MKYLLYFKPSKALQELILGQGGVQVSGAGLHCTLCVWYMKEDEKQEQRLIDELSNISFESLILETKSFDHFDNDSLVLRLSRSEELLDLHKKIVAIIETFADETFQNIKKYFGENYSPHITIGRSSSSFDTDKKTLQNQEFAVSEFFLAKKVNHVWKEMKVFD